MSRTAPSAASRRPAFTLTGLFVALVAAAGCAGSVDDAAPASSAPVTSAPTTVVVGDPEVTVPEVEPIPVATGGACAVATNPSGPWDPQTAADAASDLRITLEFTLEQDKGTFEAGIVALDAVAGGAEPGDEQRASIAAAVALIAPFCPDAAD